MAETEEEKPSGLGRHIPRPWAGRKKLAPGESKARPNHMVRAYPDEWDIIKRFVKIMRKDKDATAQAVAILEIGKKDDNE